MRRPDVDDVREWVRRSSLRVIVLTALAAALLIVVVVVYLPRGGGARAPLSAAEATLPQDEDLDALRSMSLVDLRAEESRRAAEVQRAEAMGHFEMLAVAAEALDRARRALAEREPP